LKLVSSGNKDKHQNIPQNRGGAVNGNTALNRNPSTANRSAPQSKQAAGGKAKAINQNGKPEKNINSKEVKPGRKKKTAIITIAIILFVLVIGAVALVLSLGFYVESLDTFFPNVWVEGVEVSGLTLQEAKQALLDSGYEKNADGIYVTIEFPDGSSFSFSGEDVGLSLNAEEAITNAFPFGRTDTFFGNLRTYVDSIFERTDFNDMSTPVFDDAIMHSLTEEYTAKFNQTIIHGSLERNDRAIIVTKGSGLLFAIEADVFKLASDTLKSAVEAHDHMRAEYVPIVDIENNTDVQLEMLEILFDEIHLDAQRVIYEFDMDVEGYVNIISPEADGITFDLEDAKEKLVNAAYGDSITIYMEVLEPDYTAEDVRSLIFRDVLAESTTQMTNVTNRTSNIRLAARFIDGTILKPGETFSFNGTVGQRTREKGFLAANGYRAGEVVPMIGGGICQAASTLYDAVLHTQLEIVQRSAHGMTVGYLPSGGRDATVSWPNLDFRFKNNTDFPIRIETGGSGLNITFKLIGTNIDGSKTDVHIEKLWSANFTTQEVLTDELYIGETSVNVPFNGLRVETFRVHIDADGNEISRVSMGRSSYRLINRIIKKGTKERPVEVIVDDTATDTAVVEEN